MTKQDYMLFFLQFLSCFTALHSFSLKSCNIDDSEKVVVLCQNYGLKEVPDDIPHNSETLDMSFNKISKLNATNLRNISTLVILLLNNNQLSHIDDKAFADLKALTMLTLSYNSLSNLTDQIFVGLDNLFFLHLEHNHISQISPKAFQPLVSLKQVMLDWNHIDQIRDIAMLFQSPNIEVISMTKNNFTNFDSDDLPFNTTNVKSLKLDYNPLQNFSLKRDIFPHLRSINLFRSTLVIKWDIVNKTFLRSVTALTLGGHFVGLDTYSAILHSTTTLQTLHLSVVNSRIIHKTTEVACSIPSLTTLELSYNLLTAIDDKLLRPCSQLTRLALFLNNLQVMSDQSLKSLTQLKFLNLNRNELTKVPVTIRGLSALESLDLSVNYISEVDCLDFITLINLTTLDLRGNHIARLQECHFRTLHNLNSLDISKNPLNSLENAFRVNMSKLDNLDLSGNVDHLKIKQGEFVNLSSLQVLNLRSKTYYLSDEGAFQRLNNLKSLAFSINWYSKELFQGLTQLESLELQLSYILNLKNSKNDTNEPPFSGLPNLKILSLKVLEKFIVVPPDVLSGLISLQSFSADHFFQTSIHPDTFKYTPHLLKLKIINSYLSALPCELFEPIPQLQHLDLSNNTLQSLDFLIKIKALRWLIVPKNQLSIMNETMLQTLPALRFLDVTSNPLTCECSNAGFQQWVLTNNQTQVINGHRYKCAFPVTEQENMFLEFDTHICWINFGFICFISSFCLILFTIFVAFFYSCLRWQLAYAYYLFLAYVSDTKYKKKGTGHLYDAFISYNVHNEDWVYSEMLPVLEQRQGWKLCLHHRDFEPGKPIVENITDAIYSSRKTICVISQHYLQSEWCSREIQIASARLFEEQKDVLILVFLENIPTWRLSPYYQIRRLVKKHTYLSWSRAAQHKGVFWQKLNQALKTGNSDKKHLIIEQEDA